MNDKERRERFKKEVRLSNPQLKIEFHNEHKHSTTGTVGFTPTITHASGKKTQGEHLDKDDAY